jgi:DNA-binding winged helix-turn-helix (wHTH) protein
MAKKQMIRVPLLVGHVLEQLPHGHIHTIPKRGVKFVRQCSSSDPAFIKNTHFAVESAT